MDARRVGLLAYEGVNALDLTGPHEVFTSSATELAPGQSGYEVICVSIDGGSFRSGSGLRLGADCGLDQAPAFDTIVVPGGPGIRSPEVQARLGLWLRGRAPSTRRVVSVCTGLFALGASGLMDGRKATTHWRYASEIARSYPRIRLDPDAIYIRDGAFWSSAGITAGIDLALALVEDDLGPSVALEIARMLVVHVRRAGGQRQYSEPLRFQARATDRFADLALWLPGNLAGDLSVEALAQRVCCSPRHFARLFKQSFGATPAEYVEALRLAEATERVLNSSAGLDVIAASVGYGSSAMLRKMFERRLGVSPSQYRARFSNGAAAE